MPATATTNPPDLLLPDWHIVPAAHHNVRALCDLTGVSAMTLVIQGQAWSGKAVLSACVMQESGFMNWEPDGTPVKGENWGMNKETGERFLESTDWGIVQINDLYHIGHGKDFESVDFVVNNPEIAVRFMCNYLRRNMHLNAWCSFDKGNGPFLKYLGKV